MYDIKLVTLIRTGARVGACRFKKVCVQGNRRACEKQWPCVQVRASACKRVQVRASACRCVQGECRCVQMRVEAYTGACVNLLSRFLYGEFSVA